MLTPAKQEVAKIRTVAIVKILKICSEMNFLPSQLLGEAVSGISRLTSYSRWLNGYQPTVKILPNEVLVVGYGRALAH